MMYKRQISVCLVKALALALLCSCSEGKDGAAVDGGLMRLGASVSDTRGTMIGSTSEFETAYASDGIGVWMYDKAATSACLLSNVPFIQVTYNESQIWMSDPGRKWPSVETDLYAYAPLGASLSITSGGTFSYTVPTDNALQTDLTVASSMGIPSYYQTHYAGGLLPLTFRHALAAVRFLTGTPMVAGTFKSITIGGIYTSGTYTFSTHSWAVSGSATGSSQLDTDATVTASTLAGTGITARTGTFFMMPQTFAENTQYVELVFNDGLADHHLKKYLYNLTDLKWEPGKEYIYTVSLNSTEIVLDCTVADAFTETAEEYFTISH